MRAVRVVLGNGDVLQVDREGKDKDLFHSLPGSFHTIGTVVALTGRTRGHLVNGVNCT